MSNLSTIYPVDENSCTSEAANKRLEYLTFIQCKITANVIRNANKLRLIDITYEQWKKLGLKLLIHKDTVTYFERIKGEE